MAIEIVVPRLGWSMEEGTFAEWLKKDGDHVEVGEALFVIDGDKAAQEVESFDSGILRIPPDAPAPGSTVLVGALLGYLVAPGEKPPFESSDGAGVAKSPVMANAGTSPTSHPAQAIPQPTGRGGAKPPAKAMNPTISPRARRVAGEIGVDWTTLEGSGRTGRIVERDVRAASSHGTAAAASAPVAKKPATPRAAASSKVRKIIAERMLAAAQSTAPVTLTTKADATHLVTLREQLKAAATARGAAVPAYTDLIAKLAAIALAQHPALNSIWHEGEIHLQDDIHIGIAVDTDGGLLVPVVRDVAAKTIRQIADESRAHAERARTGKLSGDALQGGTFSITNLGMHGIDAFTPLINVPQCAILGIGRIVTEPAVHNGQIVPRDMLSLSLTFDHRIVDGAPAARFLDTIRKFIEQPFPPLLDVP